MKILTANNFGHHSFEPVWRRQNMLLSHVVPRELEHWLFDHGSLTRKIIRHCQSQFRVEVLSQKWQQPMLNEALRLGVQPEQHALIREVLLYCGETPWVFARSVLPRKTLTGSCRFLGKLGNRPLGEILFSDPAIQRDELEIAEVRQGQAMFSCATQHLKSIPDSVWGRRSVFNLHKKSLLVSEFFLSSILK